MSSTLLSRRQVVRRRPPQPSSLGEAQTQVSLAITVLMGGPSSEREVSLASGEAVAHGLREAGHTVFTSDITPHDLSALDHRPTDVVFPALHGTFGEDGALQAILERRGMAFVGSGAKASALAMDKAAAKRRFEAQGLPTPPFAVFPHKPPGRALDHVVRQLDFPMVVKPVADGSSVNLSIARDATQLQAGMLAILMAGQSTLLERYVEGRELTVGILGEQILPVIEVVPGEGHESYDYDAKYHAEDTQYLLAPDFPAAVLKEVRRLAWRAHQALGCRDLSRVDFMVDADNRPWLLEVNTIPGFTSHSLVPKAAAGAGIGFPQLCDRLVRMAAARRRG
jgi:D-alanine-D-alanine ligase